MGWIIAAAVVLFFALLLAGRAAVFFDYNGSLSVKIKYLCFTVAKLPSVKKKSPKKRRKSTDGKSPEDKPKSKKKLKKGGEKKKFDLKSLSLGEKIELLKQGLSSVKKPLKKMLKRVSISHMSICVVCGGDDAAKAAIKFGAMNIAVGNVLGLLDSIFTLEPLDDMNITVDFQSGETVYDVYFEARMSLFAGLVGALGLLGAFTKVTKAYNKMSTAVKAEK